MFSAAYISTGQILGWGSKAIEIRSAETGHLDGVFMHMKDQKLKFLCERNYKVGLLFYFVSHSVFYSSVLLCCYLGDRKGICLACKKYCHNNSQKFWDWPNLE